MSRKQDLEDLLAAAKKGYANDVQDDNFQQTRDGEMEDALVTFIVEEVEGAINGCTTRRKRIEEAKRVMEDAVETLQRIVDELDQL